jgi:hypothetical protein
MCSIDPNQALVTGCFRPPEIAVGRQPLYPCIAKCSADGEDNHMDIEPKRSAESLEFREYYRTLADDELVHFAIDRDLIPAAREAITDELEARGLQDLSSFKKRFEDDAANVRTAALLPLFAPSRVLLADGKSLQYFGFTGLLILGMLGLHKWLLGDATTWRKEEALFIWLFFALILTWDPIIEVLKGQASGKRIWWLLLGLMYIGLIATALAVPAMGRVVATFNPLVVLAIFASPAIVIAIRKGARSIAARTL